MRLILIIMVLMLVVTTAGDPVQAQTQTKTVGEVTNLPVPRFVSLNDDSVFARTGPGTQYPIKWVYQRKGLPVEIVQEFDNWRKIRDMDGEEGWIYHAFLSGARLAIVKSDQAQPLLKKPSESVPAVAMAESGAQLRLDECRKDGWCRASAGGFRGWIKSDSLWGVYEHEQIE